MNKLTFEFIAGVASRENPIYIPYAAEQSQLSWMKTVVRKRAREKERWEWSITHSHNMHIQIWPGVNTNSAHQANKESLCPLSVWQTNAAEENSLPFSFLLAPSFIREYFSRILSSTLISDFSSLSLARTSLVYLATLELLFDARSFPFRFAR